MIHGVDEWAAGWSPDGREIAYTHGFSGSPFDGGSGFTTVYIVAADGSNRRRLVGHSVNGGTPAWSPDRTTIALVGYDGLYLLRTNGSQLRRIVRETFDTPGTPSWSPDGHTIAFVGTDEVVTVARDGHGLKTLARCRCDTQTDSASWSPNGRWIAFSAAHGIYLVRPDGTHQRLLLSY